VSSCGAVVPGILRQFHAGKILAYSFPFEASGYPESSLHAPHDPHGKNSDEIRLRRPLPAFSIQQAIHWPGQWYK